MGQVLLGFGALVLLFTAYQLWGTTIFESQSQTQLRQQFEAELRHREPSGTTPSSSSTTSTAPGSGTTSTGTGSTTPVAPPEGGPLGVIQIPSIGIDKVMVQGTDTADLRKGPGHYPSTALPGQAGNVAIAGHRTTYGAPFYELNELTPGALIILTTTWGTFDYSVTKSRVVSPTDLSPLAPSTQPVLTLTTCNPRFSATQRLVVTAALQSTPVAGPVGTASAGSQTNAENSGLGGEQGNWVPALWWGLAAAAVGIGVRLTARGRRRRRDRWVVYGGGSVVFLVVAFFFFAAVSPLLPASY